MIFFVHLSTIKISFVRLKIFVHLPIKNVPMPKGHGQIPNSLSAPSDNFRLMAIVYLYNEITDKKILNEIQFFD